MRKEGKGLSRLSVSGHGDSAYFSEHRIYLVWNTQILI